MVLLAVSRASPTARAGLAPPARADVCFIPKATQLLRGSAMPRWAAEIFATKSARSRHEVRRREFDPALASRGLNSFFLPAVASRCLLKPHAVASRAAWQG